MSGRKSARKMKKKRNSDVSVSSEKSSVCHKWVRKRCTRDEGACRYYHGEFPCKFYYTGLKCKFRSQCKYRHGGPLSDHEKRVLVQHVEADPPDIVGKFRRYKYSSKQLWKMILLREKTLTTCGSVPDTEECRDAKTDEGNTAAVDVGAEADKGFASKLNYENERQYQRVTQNWEGGNDVENCNSSSNKSTENGECGRGPNETKNANRSADFPEGQKVKISVCRNWVRPSKKGIKCERDESDCWYYHESFPCKFYHLGNQCRYGDRCRFTHGGPLSNHLKEVLALHITEDPDDIVGGFPRYSREAVMEKIWAHEAQMLQRAVHDKEVETKGNPIAQSEENIFHHSNKSSLPKTLIKDVSIIPMGPEETHATGVSKNSDLYGERVNNQLDVGMTAAEMEKHILATLFAKPTNNLCSDVSGTSSHIWSLNSESQNSREQAAVVTVHDKSNTVGTNYHDHGKIDDFSQLFSRRRPSELSVEPDFSSKIRKVELNIMTSSAWSPEGYEDGGGPLSEKAAVNHQKQDVDLRPFLQPLNISEIYNPLKMFPEPKTDSTSVISAGVSSHCSSSWQVYKIDCLKDTAYEELCFQKTFQEAAEDPRFRKFLRRYF